MRSLTRVFGAGLALAAMLPMTAVAQPVQIDINPTSPLVPRLYKSVSSVGWYFTPTSSFFLNSLQTRFNGAFGTNPNRTVTAEVWSNRPALGGTLLGSAGFQSNSALSVFGGGSFASLLLQGGVQYFLGFRNVMGLGMNRTNDPLSTSLGPTFVSFGPVFTDDQYEAIHVEPSPGNPTLRLIGTSVTTIPEPMTMTLLATGLVGIAGTGMIRRMRRNKQQQ